MVGVRVGDEEGGEIGDVEASQLVEGPRGRHAEVDDHMLISLHDDQVGLEVLLGEGRAHAEEEDLQLAVVGEGEFFALAKALDAQGVHGTSPCRRAGLWRQMMPRSNLRVKFC